MAIDKGKLAELGILGGLGIAGARDARQTQKELSSQIDNINSSQAQFGPDSPYAQQLRQQLERRDAQAGRRSQYGPREVELQAKLAEVNANQQARNAPALQSLYQQKAATRSSPGRDIASILARSGVAGKLSPMVSNLFKRKLPFEQGDDRDIGLNDGYQSGMSQTDFTGGDNTYDSYDFQNVSDNYDSYDFQDMSGGFDLYSGVDAGTYDSYDFQDVGSNFDLYSGIDAGTYDAYDFQSLPGFAKGGPVNIFDAIRQSNQSKTEGYKEIKQSPVEQIARSAPLQQERGDDGPNDRQEFGRGLSAANAASRFAGVKGGFLGPAAMVPGILTADNANDRTKATALAATYAVNPILGASIALLQNIGGLGGRPQTYTRQERQNMAKLQQETGTPWEAFFGSTEGKDQAFWNNGEEKAAMEFRNVDGTNYTKSEVSPVSGAVMGADGNYTGGVQQAFATGGHVQGPGTGTSDSILAKLSDGEYVNTAATVDSLGTSLFDKLEAKAKKSSPQELKKFKAGLQALF